MHVEKSHFSLTRMARLLGVSQSGYYEWAKRGPSKRAVRMARISQKVRWFHGEPDEVSGSPRILADLRDDGEIISRKTIAKTMRRLGLVGVCPQRWKTTTATNDNDTYPPDLVNREWDTGVLDAVWIGDVTYLRTWEGWLYLATVIDACSGRVIGWAIADHMRANLVQEALQMAVVLRGDRTTPMVLHTDRRTQYASEQITRFAHTHQITRSMGRTGGLLG